MNRVFLKCQDVDVNPLAKRTTVSYLSPDMACHKQQQNLGVTQVTQPHRVWHVDSSSYRPLACWTTCRQAKSPAKLFLQKLKGWGRSGNGRTPSLLLPRPMQTQH